jgi:hypothetical protein
MERNKLQEYLDRAVKLLEYEDNVNLTYCALELRRAIEFIIWKQFINAFREKIFAGGMYSIDYPIKLQNQSISKMYELLKRHIKNYAVEGSRRVFTTFLSSYRNGPLIKEAEYCYIPPELPTSDYQYLSLLIHYEKALDPKDCGPDKNKLLQIYDRLDFVYKHFTMDYLMVNLDVENILSDIKETFKLDDDKFRTFPI